MVQKKLGAAAVIISTQGGVLLVKHSYGRLNWELPGGHAEAQESLVETALREVFEETRMRVRVLHATGMYYDPAADMHHAVFLCEPLDTSARPTPDGDEITECAYWPITELPRPISSFTLLRITDAVQGANYPLPVILPPLSWHEE